MRPLRLMLVGLLIPAIASPSFAAERHAVDLARVADIVSQHVERQQADRRAIRDALARPEVRDFATGTGLDLEQMQSGVELLEGSALDRAASTARQVNQSLAGGASTITISTTTIIIGLLLLILIIVAVD